MAAGNRHGPNKLSSYLEIHNTVMRQFVDRGFVLDDEVSFLPYGVGLILVSGDVRCLGGITLTVRKLLAILPGGGPTYVQTIEYKYNARLAGVGNILRYDNPHGHRPFHHSHHYKTLDGDQVGIVTPIAENGWPTMGEVLAELEAWYFEHLDRLGTKA